jgi:transglutaminase-like putative cysteine protease
MNQRRSVALAAAAATLLAATPLSTVFATWTWAIYCCFAVGAVTGAGIAARALRARLWAQILAMLGALMVMVTWLAHAPHAFLGTIPTRATLQAFSDLVSSAMADIEKSGLPVPDTPGLLFLVSLGIGLVAVVVDVCAVGLRRPAIAGFPMLAIYAVPVFVHVDSVSPIPFIIGALGFLWLLVTDNVDRVRRFGRRFTGDGRGVDVWEPSPLSAAGRRLAVFGVAVAVALPLFLPGMTTGVLSRLNGYGPGNGPGNGSRPGPAVNLFATLAGDLNNGKTFEMLKVTTNDPNPYYLRFAEADELTANGFRNTSPGSGQAVTAKGIPDPDINRKGVSQLEYHASVTITDFDMGRAPYYLPVYQRLGAAQKLDGSWLYDYLGDQVYSNRSSTKGKTYSFDYLATTYSKAALRAADSIDPQSSIREYARVPTQEPAQVDKLVNQLTHDKTTQYDKVEAILRYFSQDNGFRYSVSTKAGTSGSDLVDFLTNKQGYCQQYAVAMAWMVRAAHYPARVAFGFTRGTSHQGQTWSLTNQDLHAWTEVYFAGIGWVPFDPTPPRTGSVKTDWAPDANSPTTSPTDDPGSTGTAQTPSGVNPSEDIGGPSHHDFLGGGDSGLPPVTNSTAWRWWLLGGLAILLIAFAVPGVRRGLLRRRRRPGRAPRSSPDVAVAAPGEMRVVAEPAVAVGEAHAAWDELIDTLVDYDVAVNDAHTPRVVARRVTKELDLFGAPADGLQLLGRAEEQARYARVPAVSGDLGAGLRSVRKAVAATRSRRARLRAIVLPPSVLRRWRYRIGTGGAGLINRLGQVRDGVVATLSPRRLLARRGTR